MEHLKKEDCYDGGSCSKREPRSAMESYYIGGVKVEFPCIPYPSQMAIMSHVVSAAQRGENALLESPTGSGKTLALLCSALAWQRKERDCLEQLQDAERVHTDERTKRLHRAARQQEDFRRQMSQKQTGCCNTVSPRPGSEAIIADDSTAAASAASVMDDQTFPCPSPLQWHHLSTSPSKPHSSRSQSRMPTPLSPPRIYMSPSPHYLYSDSDEEVSDIFKPKHAHKRQKFVGTRDIINLTTPQSLEATKCLNSPTKSQLEGDLSSTETEQKTPTYKFKVPKIYYGTRTHKQIEQVVRELCKTSYNNIRMTILSSREHTCLQDTHEGKSKTELCHTLLERHGHGCSYFDKSKVLNNHTIMHAIGFQPIWDIEDLMQLGRKKKACPYFTARNLCQTADIIFCPYNYLIDPQIRKSMNISLKGEVVILDEGHNIEDTCREAASCLIEQRDVEAAIRDCRRVAESGNLPLVHRSLANTLEGIKEWIESHKEEVQFHDYNEGSKSFCGLEIISHLELCGIGPTHYNSFKEDVEASIAVQEEVSGKSQAAVNLLISAPTKTLLGNLVTVLAFLFSKSGSTDYFALLTATLQYVAPVSENNSTWMSTRKEQQEWHYTLELACLNPALVFNDLKERCRSVILTSGTLSPLNSFQSELAAKFTLKLEASHVIPPSQVWVACVSEGPESLQLRGTYNNANSYTYQDELGKLILDICSIVPSGILCFFPSYHMLNSVYTRWLNSQLLTVIKCHKDVLIEPKKGLVMDNRMTEFYDCIQKTKHAQPGSEITGCLFLAVFRGKVSEGIDFSDENARAVITIGIPYPNIKDPVIKEKRAYNDKYSRLRGLLNGRSWYDTQAFRALNQALGRCIRHRNDWGAVIMVDSRFEENPNYKLGLSKWARQLVAPTHRWPVLLRTLRTFVTERNSME